MKIKYCILFIIIYYIINIGYCANVNTISFKVYDFKPTQPGFNLNFDEYYAKRNSLPTTGLVLDTLDTETRKPTYCCPGEHSYISNPNVFDQSFKDTEGITKSFVVSYQVRLYQHRSEKKGVYYADLLKSPATGKGWNQGNVKEHNFYWCMEGHFEFKYKRNSLSFFKVTSDIETFIYLDNKKVSEFSGVSNSSSIENKVMVHKLGLVEDQSYPLDIFFCQRFDKYANSKFKLESPFILNCVNYPGINDDVCPPVKCDAQTMCNDNDPCTLDECTAQVITPGQDKSKYCKNQPISCPPRKTLDALGIGVLCVNQKCDPTNGKCVDNGGALLC